MFAPQRTEVGLETGSCSVDMHGPGSLEPVRGRAPLRQGGGVSLSCLLNARGHSFQKSTQTTSQQTTLHTCLLLWATVGDVGDDVGDVVWLKTDWVWPLWRLVGVVGMECCSIGRSSFGKPGAVTSFVVSKLAVFVTARCWETGLPNPPVLLRRFAELL